MLPARIPRRPGKVPYPVQYDNEIADFDIWYNMYQTSLSESLTTAQLVQEPEWVLDLGCGSGFWVLEAANQWKETRIIGYDHLNMQPKLATIPHLKHLAERVQWVHGNMLDGLPFPRDHFDFVRISGIGLAVPEDEWQSLFEEVYRVLKPEGVIEVIEDDLVFPCSSSMLQSSEMTSQGSARFNALEGRYESTSTPDITEGAGPRFSKLFSRRTPRKQYPCFDSPASTESIPETEHPQDHTRLKICWDSMLASRFLASKLSAVLPFYMSSAGFHQLTLLPSTTIPLPPNSGSITAALRSVRSLGTLQERDRIPSLILDFGPPLSSHPTEMDRDSIRAPFSPSPKTFGPNCSTMHLAKVVSTIRGCKEAIYSEYAAKYSKEARYLLSRTAPEEDVEQLRGRHVIRRAFEVDWMNWELDMQDRMCMRRNVVSTVAWKIPVDEVNSPQHRAWRSNLDRRSGPESSGHCIAGYNPDDVCRSIRTFIARKPPRQ